MYIIPKNRVGKSDDGCVKWACVCECGTETVVQSKCLRSGNTKSCGCGHMRNIVEIGHRNRAHGHAVGGKSSAEYRAWSGMRGRCYNKSSQHFKDYGARGITVCDEWRNSFEAFYRDMGPRPRGMTIERKNNDLGYSKANCIWATHTDQMRNRRSVVMSIALARQAKQVRESGGNLAAWARERGIDQRLAWSAASGRTWVTDGTAAAL